jgi:alpha-tubulin suppressor-like RCC1 family protein
MGLCTLFSRPSYARALFAAALSITLVSCQQDQQSPTAPDSELAPVITSAAALAFWQLSAGSVHSCGVTTDNLAYCWGDNGSGQLGTGSDAGPESCTGAAGPFPCGTRPVLVVGGHQFHQVSAGDAHTCGVTTDHHAYCWGAGGELGDGTTNQGLAPVAVAGAHQFRQVDAGLSHTCGVSYPDNQAYCWGSNDYGQLGDGTLTRRLRPVLVLGGLQFRQVSAGQWHTCGVTTINRVFCWGWNKYGQIGDSSTAFRRLKPHRVAGSRQYRQVEAGGYHSCAVTTTDRAFCWGNGNNGQLGNGKTYLSFWPRAVAGGLNFDRVTTGLFHTCGETTADRAYCWGSNSLGQLGDGTTTGRLTPVAVAGGLSFGQVSAGSWHTCGKSLASAGYCWGYGFFGELGDGSSGFGAESSTPTSVAGPL